MKFVRLVVGLLAMLSFLDFTYADDKEISSIHVSHAYVNSMPPGTNVTAGFFEIKNTGNAEVELKSVSSPAVEKIGLHSTSMANGKMKMQMLGSLAITAGEKVKFEHGGLHLMLWGLDKSLQPGSYINLTLHFTGGLKKTVQAEIRDVRVKKSHDHKH